MNTEILNNITEKTSNWESAGGTGTYNYTAQEILSGSVGCKSQYQTLLIDMKHEEQKRQHIKKPVEYEIHIKKGKEIITKKDDEYYIKIKPYYMIESEEEKIKKDIRELYVHNNKRLIRMRGNRKLLKPSDLNKLTQCAICSQVQNKKTDTWFSEFIGVTRSEFNRRYSEILNNIFIYIDDEIRIIVKSIHKRKK